MSAVKRWRVAPGIEVVPRILSDYPHGLRTEVAGTGISTAILADRFRGGDSVAALALDYTLHRDQVEAALRWELYTRQTRCRHVLRAIGPR